MPFIKSFFFLFFFSQVGCDESQNLLIWSDKADALWHQSGLFPAEPEQQSDCSGSFFLICARREIACKSCCFASPRLSDVHSESTSNTPQIRRLGAANPATAPAAPPPRYSPPPAFRNQRSPTDGLFFLHPIMSFISSTSCLPSSVVRILSFEIKLM